MNLQNVSDEVFVSADPMVRIGASEIDFIKEQARNNPRKRARICTHRTNDDPLHEMVVALASNSYIRPHRHVRKSESFHIIEGEVDVALFDDAGNLRNVVTLGGAGTGRSLFYRLSDSIFHTLLIRTEFLVLHEVTNGPFDPRLTEFAPFAPAEEELKEVRNYMNRLSRAVAEHLGR